MTGNPQDGEDIAQEAFIKAYRSLPGFRGESKFSVWLYRIVSNLCLDFLRRKARRQTLSLTVEDEEGEESQLDIPDESLSPERMLDRNLSRESLSRGLDSLPPEQREILLLREIQGLSYEEIARALDLEAGTVKSRIFRARKRLAAFLLEEGNNPEYLSSKKRERG